MSRPYISEELRRLVATRADYLCDLLAGNMARVLSVLQEGLASEEYAMFLKQLAEH